MFTVHASRIEEVTMFPTTAATPNEPKPRALVLDGDDASLAAMQRAFADLHVTAVTARDGAAGLGRLLDELLSLDVLVVDLDLPQRDARSLARLVRGAGNEQDLAIVVLASDPSAALRDELDALGVDAVVDRRQGPAAAAVAALEAVENRRATREMELEPWRNGPALTPIGETSFWCLGAGGQMAMVA
jgi:CheY-like chemotaxis protein